MASINRIIMQRQSRKLLEQLDLSSMDAAEISGKYGNRYQFKSYKTYPYPKYDICNGPYISDKGRLLTFDIILANQVWEHLDRPYAATHAVNMMLRDNGYFWLAVPFFIPYHAAPDDCSRWSARGLKNLLIECGFDEAKIKTGQWGNRNAAQRNLEEDWPPKYDRELDDLTNDTNFPICSWALAQR